MKFKNNLLLGIIYDIFAPLLVNYAVTGCIIGLASSYFVTQHLGWDEKTSYWTLTAIGTILGVIFDFDGMRSEAVDLLHILGYLFFVFFIMACVGLTVLYNVGPQ